MKVITQKKERCSYRCPYYLDGPVLSLCNKFNEVLVYDGKAPPLVRPKCKQSLVNEEEQRK